MKNIYINPSDNNINYITSDDWVLMDLNNWEKLLWRDVWNLNNNEIIKEIKKIWITWKIKVFRCLSYSYNNNYKIEIKYNIPFIVEI